MSTENTPSPEVKTASVRLVDGGVAFDATSGSGHTIRLDSSPEHGGTDRGPSPTEAVLMALAGCTGMDVISMLRKMRQDVTDYRIDVRGLRADEHPRVFTDIEVVHVVTGRDLKEASVKRAVELSATKYCSVSAMLDRGSKLTHRWEIVEAEPAP